MGVSRVSVAGWHAVACLAMSGLTLDACAEPLVGSIYRAWPNTGRPIDDGSINRTIGNTPGWRERRGGEARANERVCFRARLVRGDAGKRVRFSIAPSSIGSITVTRQAGLSCGASQTVTTSDGPGGRRYVDCVTTGPGNPRNALICVNPPVALAGGWFRAGFSIPGSGARYTVIKVDVRPPVAATPSPPMPEVERSLRACVRFGDLAQSHSDYKGVHVPGGGSAMWRAGRRYYTFGGSQTPSPNTYSRASWIRNGSTWERKDCNSALQVVRTTTLYLTGRPNGAPNPSPETLQVGSFAGFSGLRYYLEVRNSPAAPGTPVSGIVIRE